MPLPVTSGLYDVGPGGSVVTSLRGANALRGENAQADINESKAQYAPYTEYANALSHVAYANNLPYQIKATMLSNPLLWLAAKDDPRQMAQLNSMMQSLGSNVSTNVNAMPGGMSLPLPSGRSNGLLGAFLSHIAPGLGGNAPQAASTPTNALNQAPGASMSPADVGGVPGSVADKSGNPVNPLVPATGGALAGAVGANTAKYTASPYKSGDLIPNQQGGVTSVPTKKTGSALQQSINATERLIPQLEELPAQAAPFLSAGGMFNEATGAVKNFLFPNSPTASGLPTQKAAFEANLKGIPESLVKAFGLNVTDESIKLMRGLVEPRFGENSAQYDFRIKKLISDLKEKQLSVNKRNLSEGFSMGGTPNQENAEKPKAEKSTSAKETKEEKKFKASNGGIAAFNDEDLQFTADKYGMTVPEVKQYLGLD